MKNIISIILILAIPAISYGSGSSCGKKVYAKVRKAHASLITLDCRFLNIYSENSYDSSSEEISFQLENTKFSKQTIRINKGKYTYLIQNDSTYTYPIGNMLYRVNLTSSGLSVYQNIPNFEPENFFSRRNNGKPKITEETNGFYLIEQTKKSGYFSSYRKLWVNKSNYLIDSIYSENIQWGIIVNSKFTKIEYHDINFSKPVLKSALILPPELERYSDQRPANGLPKITETALVSSHSKFPRWNMIDTSSSKVSSLDFKSKIVIYDFSYFSCPPCIKSIPHLNKISKKYKNEVIVIGVNNHEGIDLIQLYSKKFKVAYPIFYDNAGLTSKLSINSFPTVVLVDENGKIVWQFVGYSKANNLALNLTIKSLIATRD